MSDDAELLADLWNEEVAQGYDEDSAYMYAPEVLDPTVEFLARRAADGPALEFAVGTGRVALPLRARGVRVSGIEMSEPMARRLRAKPGGEHVDVTIGDMATTRVPGEFGLVYLVYNGISNLLSQDEQVECFRNAARHLAPGGRFVIEVGVPDLQRLPPGETARPFHIGREHLGFDTYDLVNQRLVSHHYRIVEGHTATFRSPHRYVWPAELDLMARLAGLIRTERWADWSESPFTDTSTTQISVWQKPAAGSAPA
ncbi:class I SAM-dependent methyltransferase [Streptomyces sp. B6B3]|uniref:class I SAM-dependent DNA methyltransferase n=1 Tax=Streptomyces sp. B6B3 TaxID=3153570 RepID=UPI00325DB5EB